MFTSAGCKSFCYMYSRYISDTIYIRGFLFLFLVLFLYMGLCSATTNDLENLSIGDCSNVHVIRGCKIDTSE